MTQVQPGAEYPPPPPPAYAGGNTPVTAVVIQQQSMGVAAPGQLGPYRELPVYIACQFCGANVTTKTRYAIGLYTFLISLVLICVGMVVGCCLIPFFLNSCKDVVHTCPNCNNVNGRYSKM